MTLKNPRPKKIYPQITQISQIMKIERISEF